jgi:hypothetical protein
MVPDVAAGERVAVSVTLAPEGAVVTTTEGADVSAAASTVVVVACDTVTVLAAEVLDVSSAGVVGVKTAVREAAPRGSAVVARVAVPEPTVTGPPSVEAPILKVTVPAAVEGDTAAVNVTPAPNAAVVIAVDGADVSPTASVVVVVACVTVTEDAAEVLAA